jgi:phospholipase/carboxylesterase
MIVSETTVHKHRVVVMDPPILKAATPVLVGLHGLGTNAEDFMDLAQMMDLGECRIVLPDAPLHLPGYPPGAYAWYDFETHERSGIEKSRDHLFKVFDRFMDDPNVRHLDGDPKTSPPLIVFGFSQGGVMTLESGLNYPGKIAALISMSGYMPDPSKTLADPKLPKDTPILVIHGTYDDVVPVQGSREAVKELEQAGYKPELREFEYAHQISEESLETVAYFIRRALKI